MYCSSVPQEAVQPFWRVPVGLREELPCGYSEMRIKLLLHYTVFYELMRDVDDGNSSHESA